MRWLGVEHMVRLIDRVGLGPLLLGLVDRLEGDFRRWERFERAPRVASHSRDGVIELMPTSDGTRYGFKFVNGHPRNTARGLPTVTAFGVLADVATGRPVLLSEMTLATALRTAATSALAARHLARADARTMAIVGLGAQSEFQAVAFEAVLGIRRLRIHDVDPDATAKFVANLAGRGFEVVVARNVGEAVEGADVVTTVTADKRRATVLADNHVGAGVHLNAVGGDCPGKTELQKEILARADVFVELTEQTRIEGEIQQMAADFPVTELWRVITGLSPGRTRGDQITVFDSVGFALEDFAALAHVAELAEATGCFGEIDLIAAPADPRDLFGLLGGAAGRRAEASA